MAARSVARQLRPMVRGARRSYMDTAALQAGVASGEIETVDIPVLVMFVCWEWERLVCSGRGEAWWCFR